MNKGIVCDISCDVCRDLIPLVADQVASADSEELVRHHIARCEACKVYLESGGVQLSPAPMPDAERLLGRIQRRLILQTGLLSVAAVLFSVLLAGSPYLIWALPLVGAAGFVWMKQNAWLLPLVLCPVLFVTVAAFRLELWAAIITAVFYTLALLLGILAAMLLHFAFGGLHPFRRHQKEESFHDEPSETPHP